MASETRSEATVTSQIELLELDDILKKIDVLPLQPHAPATLSNPDDATSQPKKKWWQSKKTKPAATDKKPDPESTLIPISGLFRFADGLDILLMIVGSIGAIGLGGATPVMTIVFSDVIDALSDFTIALSLNQDLQAAKDRLNHDILLNTYYFLALAVGSFIVSYAMLSCWMITGERQTKRVRERFFAAILRQEMAWFDSNSTGDLTTRISGDTSVLQEGISDKIGLIIQNLSTFIAGFVIAFVKGWKLALVLLAVMPLLVGIGAIMSSLVSSSTSDGQDAYGEAGSIASQVFGSIRTVIAFGGEQKEIDRYINKLDSALRVNTKKALISALGLGSVMLVIYATYALAFWYGGTLVIAEQMTGGQVLNVFFSLIIGAFALGNGAPHVTSVANARGAATKLYQVIDRVPKIPITEKSPTSATDVVTSGEIVLSNISFRYPSRPDIQVLNNFSLHVKAGQTVALVGSSGSGKSTIVSLLERFYEPSSGTIILDGQPLQSIPPHILRERISIVSQEPVLFSASIFKNIALGIHTEEEKNLTEEEIHRRVESAARLSNAHDFIMNLPDKYDTLVGSRGSQMSGGQKQRIAIARAMVSNPSILLLDEATSALDTESERLVQGALEVASEGRTTIVIAHRLSTIKDADLIVVMVKGDIVEQGTHEQLIALQGVYYGLVKSQEVKTQRQDGKVTETILTTPAEVEEGTEDVETASNTSNATPERTVVAIKRSAAEVEEQKKMKEAKGKEEEDRLSKLPMPLMRVLRLNMAEWPLLLVGCLAACVSGATQPLFSIVFSQILSVFSTVDADSISSGTRFWALMFIALAGGAFLSNFFQSACFTISGERLTKRIRTMTFTTLIRQEVAFFDEERHSAGALTARLANDASKIEGLAGTLLGTIIQTVVTLVVGIAIAFANGWKLSLVILACLPVIAGSGFLEMKALTGYGGKTRKAYEESGQIANEAIENVRTIASLTREGSFNQMYLEIIRKPHRIAVHGFLVASVGFAASQAIMFLAYALAFWYGAQLIMTLEYTQKQMMIAMFTIVFSALAAGQISTFAPNIAKAKVAAYNVFEILDRSSSIDPMAEGGDRPAPVTGETDIKGGEFTYPARPNIQILKGLDLSVHRGKTVAIVGPSGSGKSTVVQLVQRFYDLDRGEITVNSVRVPDWNIGYLRSQLSLVGQEPVLFDLTIAENIAYGYDGASQEQIEEAAKAANIHSFISELTDGYQTRVGERGTQLSGGQRQRLAIARAIIRRPKLLLLDEATSALDSESEKVVQSALDNAAIGRTTITIAHRLSTIQNADWIVVLKKGLVVEQGKHMDLIEQRGVYYKLVNKQMLMGPDQ